MIHEDAKYTDTGLYKNIGELIRDCARDMSIDELEAWADDVDIALMAARKERGRKSIECHTLASELDNIMEVLREKRDEEHNQRAKKIGKAAYCEEIKREVNKFVMDRAQSMSIDELNAWADDTKREYIAKMAVYGKNSFEYYKSLVKFREINGILIEKIFAKKRGE